MAEESPKTFFSYARADSEFVLRLVKDLRAAGAAVWLDQLDIQPGQRWDQAVEEALRACARHVVILSPASVKSSNVMDEVSYALDEGKQLIPILQGDCQIPFRLRRLQHIDFRTSYDHGLEELLRVLGAAAPAKVTAGPPPPPPPDESKPFPGPTEWTRQETMQQPQDAAGFNERGNAYLLENEFDQAIQDFDQALRLNPRSEEYLCNRGDAYLFKGQYDAALADYHQAIKLKPGCADAVKGCAYAYEKQGDFRLALLNYEELLRWFPKDASAYLGRAGCYLALGDHVQAFRDYDQALRLKPNDDFLLFHRGKAYYDTGQFERAVQDFDQVIRANPNRGNVVELRAEAAARLKGGYRR